MDQKRLFSIVKKPVVHWSALLVIGLTFFGVDSSITEALYLYVFEMPDDLATWLSRGMAVIYLILAVVSGRLLARDLKQDFGIAVSIFLALNVCALFGQHAAMELMDNDPFADFLNDGEIKQEESSAASYRHWIAVGLTIVLFSCATFIEYLVARSSEEMKPTKKSLQMSGLLRWFQSKVVVLEGIYKRALANPENIAKERVNARIEKLEKDTAAYERKEQELKSQLQYQLHLIVLMHRLQVTIIEAVYNNKKPSFFKNLFK